MFKRLFGFIKTFDFGNSQPPEAEEENKDYYDLFKKENKDYSDPYERLKLLQDYECLKRRVKIDIETMSTLTQDDVAGLERLLESEKEKVYDIVNKYHTNDS